jgi:HlyD family secretion protein
LRQDRDNGELIEASVQLSPIDIRSDEVQEILNYIPHWIVRWGIAILFLTIFMLLGVSWIIKYPDIISSRITITTQTPPASVIARSPGKLAKLFVKDNEMVMAGAYLAAIENPADLEDAFALKKLLKTLTIMFENPDKVLEIEFDQNAVLGELQADYSNFVHTILQYKIFRQEQPGYHADKIKAIEAQMAYYQQLNGKAARQKDILTEELNIGKKKFDKDKTLFAKGFISEVELSNSESAYLEKQRGLENAEAMIITNSLQLTELRKTIMDLKYRLRDEERQLTLSFSHAVLSCFSEKTRVENAITRIFESFEDASQAEAEIRKAALEQIKEAVLTGILVAQ